MTIPGWADDKVAELLPCEWRGLDGCFRSPGNDHMELCPANHRPAVAAALRAERERCAGMIERIVPTELRAWAVLLADAIRRGE